MDEIEEFNNIAGSGSKVNSLNELKSLDNAISSQSREERDLLPNLTSYRMWARADDEFYPCERAEKALEPGQYLIQHSQSRGFFFSKKVVNLDELLVLPDSNSERVLNSINEFWKLEHKFRKFGFLWKRGILLWGPPGSGKTSTVQQLSKQIIDVGGISIYCQYPRLDATGLRLLRRIEPKRPIVFMIEDIDAVIRNHGEADLLALLDGELQVDNIVFVATTNYPELLDKRFINRPSRFDEVIKIGMPSPDARRTYLAFKNPRLASNKLELDAWVADTDNFSIAHMRELIVSVECLGHSATDAVKRLRAMNNIKLTSEEKETGFGFTG